MKCLNCLWRKTSDLPLVSQSVLLADCEGDIVLGEYYSKHKEFSHPGGIEIIGWMTMPDFPEDFIIEWRADND